LVYIERGIGEVWEVEEEDRRIDTYIIVRENDITAIV
jgi:hypothetical protein